jgi:beta-xylosidase
MRNNPVIWADYPDVDVIRVGDTYYMISTTMHFFPGGVILRSHDLVHWETACHIYDALDGTPAQRMEEGLIYSKGMWAASLRYHDGLFHAVFAANDTGLSYHYTADRAEGPWTRRPMKGFYHDNSVLFDDDGRVWIVHGNRNIRLTEMEPDLSGPLPGGFDRVILRDEGRGLGYEGSHLYKINGRYYLFLIHWPAGHMRTEAVFSADSLTGEWTGGDALEDDMGFFRQGVAQGGIVDTPGGNWYAMLFQDHGAVGRIPVLVPVRWEDGMPKLSKPPEEIRPEDCRPGYAYKPLCTGDDFTSDTLDEAWEWNHQPRLSLIRFGGGELRITTDRTAADAEHARNTLTQRTFGPGCAAEVTVDGSEMKIGDRAGLCALQGLFAEAFLERDADGFGAVLSEKTDEGIRESARIKTAGPVLRLRAEFDFRDLADTVRFFAEQDGAWTPLGGAHKLVYRLDHFTGARIGLFCYGTKETGGSAAFREFVYTVDPE